MSRLSIEFASLLVGLMCIGELAAAEPIVIAHRGASGYLPEHTLAAKALAFAMGADYLEQDLVLSKDGIPVVLHDIHLDTVTDVAQLFPDRKRSDGRFYALDFTVAEIKQLNVTERTHVNSGQAVFSDRFPVGPSGLKVPTFEEELAFVAGLKHSTRRSIGIYPEIKHPHWHRQQGVDLSRAVLDCLAKYGYKTKDDLCWLQCFEYEEIKRLRGELGWQGRLVQLLSHRGKDVDGTDYQWLLSEEGLTELANLVDGIGPEISSIIQGTSPDNRVVTRLVADAHARGLAVHPYTVRKDALPKTVRSIDDLHELLFRDAKVDGVFTDFPDITAAFLTASQTGR